MECAAPQPDISIDKARRGLGNEPPYEGIETVREAVDWLATNHQINVPAPVAAN